MMYVTGNVPNQIRFELTAVQSLDPEAVMITHQMTEAALCMFLIVQVS